MHALRWFFIALPFVGLAWIIAEAIIRDRHALLEAALDSEAFLRTPVPAVAEPSSGTAPAVPDGLEVHGPA